MATTIKEKLLLGTSSILAIFALVEFFFGNYLEVFVAIMLALFALFLFSQFGDKTAKHKKLAFRISIYLGVIVATLSAVIGGLMVYVFSQFGNTDVRWQNNYHLPKFSYGYLSSRDGDKEFPLYVSINAQFGLGDAKMLDCMGNCSSGRVPYLSTRSADCTRANPKDANDPNCASKDFQIIKRYDGKKQWAYLGHLLYYYPNRPRNGSWWQPNIDDITSKNETGWRPVQSLYFYHDILVNAAGKTVYQASKNFVCKVDACSGITPVLADDDFKNILNTTIFNQINKEDKQSQLTHYDRLLFTANADQQVGDLKDLENSAVTLEAISFKPAFESLPSEKYLKDGEKYLRPQKTYYFNFRGQFLAIPKDSKTVCMEECTNYFVPYLVEEDATQKTRFGNFEAKSIGNELVQWFYQNQPVFVVVNSYGWPFLEKLDTFKMQLITP
jgi:predicted lipoprotein with Yx(FWY)xxD motif